jgi:hypothetical protein
MVYRAIFLVPYQLLAVLAISPKNPNPVSPRHNPGTLNLESTHIGHNAIVACIRLLAPRRVLRLFPRRNVF